MSEIQNPHDQFVRSTLSDKKMAKSFLENYLPIEIVETLNLSKIEVSQESFVGEDLQEHHTDLFYQVATKNGEKVFVYVLLEHKSSPEKLVAFQLLRYLVRIWEKHKTAKKLPNVIPLVLYHGKRKWNISREFASLVEFGTDKIYAKSTPNFEYFICDLSKFEVKTAMQTAFTTEQKQEDWFQEIIDELREEAKEKAMKEGWQEGLSAGMQQGMQQGLAQTASKLLHKRFGEISAVRENQISELSISELEKLNEDLLDFTQLADFDEWLLKKSN